MSLATTANEKFSHRISFPNISKRTPLSQMIPKDMGQKKCFLNLYLYRYLSALLYVTCHIKAVGHVPVHKQYLSAYMIEVLTQVFYHLPHWRPPFIVRSSSLRSLPSALSLYISPQFASHNPLWYVWEQSYRCKLWLSSCQLFFKKKKC